LPECFESFAAFDEYLAVGGAAVRPALRLLLCEYRRYALERAWLFYPDALPEAVIANNGIRNGRIDRRLSFPLEDLYADEQPAGQVGQEIYGCGGAFIFAARAFFSAAQRRSACFVNILPWSRWRRRARRSTYVAQPDLLVGSASSRRGAPAFRG
jgi:hypothetical protein